MITVDASWSRCLNCLGTLALKGFKKQIEWRSELTQRVNLCVQKVFQWLIRPALKKDAGLPEHEEEARASRSPSPAPKDPGEPDSVPTRPHSLAHFWRFKKTPSPAQRAFESVFASFMRSLSPSLPPQTSAVNLPYGSSTDR